MKSTDDWLINTANDNLPRLVFKPTSAKWTLGPDGMPNEESCMYRGAEYIVRVQHTARGTPLYCGYRNGLFCVQHPSRTETRRTLAVVAKIIEDERR